MTTKRKEKAAEIQRNRRRDNDVQESRDWPRWPCWRVERTDADGRVMSDPRGSLPAALRAAAVSVGPRLSIAGDDLARFQDLDERAVQDFPVANCFRVARGRLGGPSRSAP